MAGPARDQGALRVNAMPVHCPSRLCSPRSISDTQAAGSATTAPPNNPNNTQNAIAVAVFTASDQKRKQKIDVADAAMIYTLRAPNLDQISRHSSEPCQADHTHL